MLTKIHKSRTYFLLAFSGSQVSNFYGFFKNPDSLVTPSIWYGIVLVLL